MGNPTTQTSEKVTKGVRIYQSTWIELKVRAARRNIPIGDYIDELVNGVVVEDQPQPKKPAPRAAPKPKAKRRTESTARRRPAPGGSPMGIATVALGE